MIGSYHRLFNIEKSFRMSKQDLQARPTYHHGRDSIEAHLTIAFAALAMFHGIEKTGEHVITAADPLPGDLGEHPGQRWRMASEDIIRWSGSGVRCGRILIDQPVVLSPSPSSGPARDGPRVRISFPDQPRTEVLGGRESRHAWQRR